MSEQSACWCGGEIGPRIPGDANGLGCLEDIDHAYNIPPAEQRRASE